MTGNVHRQAEIQSQLLTDHVQGLIDALGSIVAATVQLFGIVKIQVFLHQIEDVFAVRAFLCQCLSILIAGSERGMT